MFFSLCAIMGILLSMCVSKCAKNKAIDERGIYLKNIKEITVSNIDTLQAYDNLVESGFTPTQARAQVKTYDSCFAGIATKNDVMMLEKDLKIFFSWEIAAVVVTIMGLSFFNRLIGKR